MMSLDIELRWFLSKVLKVRPVSFFPRSVKREKRERNWRRNCNSNENRDWVIWDSRTLQ